MACGGEWVNVAISGLCGGDGETFALLVAGADNWQCGTIGDRCIDCDDGSAIGGVFGRR